MSLEHSSPRIILVPMAPGRDEEFARMLDEFREAGELDVYKGHHAVAWEGYASYYALLSRMKLGGYPTPEIVPTDPYFIEEDGQILGELFIRRRLSPQLEQMGGHIGYKVRPSSRNRGVATAALKLALQLAGKLGVERALLTCNTNNSASARVIEKCGGVRIADTIAKYGIERRYWIESRSAGPGLEST